MSEAPTVRTHLGDPEGARESVRRLVTRPGKRHRCTSCFARGVEHEPAYLCHHCGRLFCEVCAPYPSKLRHLLFHHRELSPFNIAREGASLSGWPGAEAVHCPRCLHPVPRLAPWLALSALLSLLAMGFLWLTYWDGMVVTFAPLFLVILLSLIGFGWRAYDRRFRRRLFFPITGKRPRFLIMEEVNAEGVLDGSYHEKVDPGTPRGTVRATVPLNPEMAAQLDAFARVHNLTELQLENIEATAGQIVLEQAGRITRPNPRWPARGARAWPLAAPLPSWPLVWTGRGAREKVLDFGYRIDLQAAGGTTFPLQIQAHFPEDSDRLTLQLHIVQTGHFASIPTKIQQVVIRRDQALPGFALQPGRGRPVSRKSEEELEVDDLPFDRDNIARLSLRFNQAPDAPEAWLSGSLLLVLPTLLSGLQIDGYYSPLGYRDDRIQVEQFSRIMLHFRLNVGSLRLQETSTYSDTIRMPGVSPERDDAVLQALGENARIVRIHENALDAVTGNGAFQSVPTREVLAHWPMSLGDQLSPVIFRAHFLPQGDTTRLRVEVEAPVADPVLLPTRARDIWERIREIVVQADRTFRNSARRPAARTPPAEKGINLLSKLKGSSNE